MSETAREASPPPAFDSRAWMGLYLERRHDELSEAVLGPLRHFRDLSYASLDRNGRRFVNEFLKHFLTFWTQPDFVPNRPHLGEFVRLNPVIANLAAISSFGTTDAFLPILDGLPSALGKTLALLSARSATRPDRKAIFDADPSLASVWFGAYGEAYRGGLVSPRVVENLRDHFAYEDDRLDARYAPIDGYFGSTYVGGGCDRVAKRAINASLRRRFAATRVPLRDRPDPKKVAVISGSWSPDHSAYRIVHAHLRALKDAGYHLTFFPLGAREPDTGLFDDTRPLRADKQGAIDLRPIMGNDFQVVYYPDVGLTTQSVSLSNLRLAPIQVAGLGHSVSTFGSQVDYFVSGAGVEPPDHPERNYSERLVLLPGWGAVHNRPAYAPTGRAKVVPEVVINAPWTSQKVNHRFALTVREILRRCERPVRLRLFPSSSLHKRNDMLPFVADLEGLLGRESVEVGQGVPYPEYMARMEEGDFSLDSFPFGGCNTVADSLFLRKPVLTWEGNAWYNRIGPAMVRAAGLPELAATSEDQYVATALRLIHDDGYRDLLCDHLETADLDATVFSGADARAFPRAIAYLTEHHDRLRGDPSREPIRIEP